MNLGQMSMSDWGGMAPNAVSGAGTDMVGGQMPSRTLPGGAPGPDQFLQLLSSKYEAAISCLQDLVHAQPDEVRGVKIEGFMQKLKEMKVDQISEIRDAANQAQAFMSGVT